MRSFHGCHEPYYSSGVGSGHGSAIDGVLFAILGGPRFSWRLKDASITVPADTGTVKYGTKTYSEAHKMTFAGTLSKMGCRVGGSGFASQRMVPTTVTIRKNGALTDCKVVIGAFAGGFIVGTGSVTFVSGDYIDAQIDSPAQDITDPLYVGDDTYLTAVWVEMNSTGGDYSVMRVGPWGSRSSTTTVGENCSLMSWTAVANDFQPMSMAGDIRAFWNEMADGAASVPVTNEATLISGVAMAVGANGTYSGMRVHVPQNSILVSAPITLKFIKNSSNGTQSVTLTNLAGFFDASGSDAVTNTDLINYAMRQTGNDGGQTLVTCIDVDFASTYAEFDVFVNSDPNETTLARYQSNTYAPHYTAGSYFFSILGANTTHVASDTPGSDYGSERVEIALPGAYELYYLRARVGYFSGDPVILRTYIDGAPGEQSITINAAGAFLDSVGDENVTTCNGGRICYELYVPPGSSCYMRLDSIAMTAFNIDEDCTGASDDCDKDCEGGMTMGEMIDTTLVMLGESATAPVYWSRNEVARNLDDAYVEACRETKALELIEGVALTSGAEAATLSRFVGQIFRVTFDDRKIDNLTKWELDRTETNWEALSGWVTNYVTTLQDNRTISTFKAWDGTAYNAQSLFNDDPAHTYAAWANATVYVGGTRVTLTSAAGIVTAYECIVGHTAATATNKPGSGSAWVTYWVPIALMVWAVKNPDPLLTNCEEPELPPWTHLALCYRAAAKCLRKFGEMKNGALADVYDGIAGEYATLLKGFVGQRTPDRLTAMSGRFGAGTIAQRTYIPPVTP